MDIEHLKTHYRGFSIDTPQGNNAFSFERRQNKRIFVPPLVKGDVDAVRISEEVSFSEVEDLLHPGDGGGCREINARGLAAFVNIEHPGQDIVIVDNHNHVFFFWCAAAFGCAMPVGLPLVHVDQHKDMREPEKWLDAGSGTGRQAQPSGASVDLSEVFHYTNFVLNVGNFIPPALKLGIFSEVIQVGSREAFERVLPPQFVLDIDLDIFAPVMSYIPDREKTARLREWIARAAFVTIATSPFFIDQATAVDCLKDLLALRGSGGMKIGS